MYASTERVWEQQHSNSNKHTDLPDLAFSTLFSTKKNKDSLETRQIPGLGQGNYRINLKYHLVPESKKMPKSTLLRDMSKKKKKTTKTRNQPEGALIGQI